MRFLHGPLLNLPLKILDWFLNREQSKSVDAVMRGRMIVAFLLSMIAANIAMITFTDQFSVYVFVALPVFCLAELLCLYLIKRFFSPERVFAVFAFFSQVLTVLAFSLRVPTEPDLIFSFFIFAYVIGLFITNQKTSLILQASNFIASGFCCLVLLKKIGGPVWEIANPTKEQVVISSVVNQALFFVLIAIVLKIRKLAQNDIDQEIEWQQRSMRLEELSSMTRTMRLSLEGPVRNLNTRFGRLKSEYDAPVLKRIESDLDELLLISQSFSWVYRAFRLEGSSSIPSHSFLVQLRSLVSNKVREEGWLLAIRHTGEPFEIYGPLPSIMLFLFSVIVQIVEGEASREKKELSLELDRKEKLITWRLSWALRQARPKKSWFTSESPTSSMRQELIADLMRVCGAEIQEFEEPPLQGLLISGAWSPV